MFESMDHYVLDLSKLNASYKHDKLNDLIWTIAAGGLHLCRTTMLLASTAAQWSSSSARVVATG